MIILHNTCQILMNCAKKLLVASATATRTLVNSSPSPVKFRSYTDSVLCSAPSGQVTILLFTEWISFWFLRKVSKNTVRFCVSTFEGTPSGSEFSLSEECASTCVCRTSRLSVKGCNKAGMRCVGSSLFVSSAGSRFPCDLLVRICQHRFPAWMLVTSSCYWI